ncbi:MAG: mechanosensitive ion channel family protein [Dehalococcoidia bacterium]|nr:mechanosensitive ion channel family protein [Dehalococcoidia bacterium]
MFSDNTVLNAIIAACIFVAAIILSLGVTYFSRVIKRRFSSHSLARLLLKTIDRIARAIVALFIINGALLALASLNALSTWRAHILIACAIVFILVVTYILLRNIGTIFTWRLSILQARTTRHINTGAALFFKRIIQIVLSAISLMLILALLGIPVGPLLASLGIGGIAVALAIQPTLANFFAGMQIVSDNVVHIGDFVELDDKLRGYVVDIGWRSTKIRTTANNIIIAPNSILADSKLINYNQPNHTVNVIVRCGVSYENNLDYVKKLALEVAADIEARMDEAVKNFEPRVAFDEFGESNIVFVMVLQAKDRLASINLKSELIARLHQRFREENIKINYPLRLTHPK